MKLTPQQKVWQKKRNTLTGLHNRILSRMSFGVVRTWGDYYKEAGQPNHENSGQAVTRDELKKLFKEQSDELERTIQDEQSSLEKPIYNNGGETILRKDTNNLDSGQDNVVNTNRTKNTDSNENSGSPVLYEPPAPQLEVLKNNDKTPSKRVHLQEVEELIQNEQNDYGLVQSPNENGFHYWHQKKAIAQVLHKIHVEKRHGILVLAKTGEGKTFIVGGTLRRLEDIHFAQQLMPSGMPRSMSVTPFLYVTRSSIVTQTERVLKNKYNMTIAQCEVCNIEVLRSKAGRMWVTEKMEVRAGKEEYFWQWKPAINPCVIVWDECQALKNDGSTQHQIAAAYNDLPDFCDTYQLFVSATPFTRVCEAKCWAVSTRRNIEHLGFPKGTILNNKTWPAYAGAIAAPSSPYEYNESAVDRLMKDLDDYIVQVKGVRPQFDAINCTELIDFQSKEEEDYYRKAWDRYLEEKAKLDAIAAIEGKGATGINELVAFQKFRMCAELCRKEYLAKEMYDIVQHKKKAAVCALNFKGSIMSVVKILCDKYKVPRSQISLIWGGGQTELTQKQKNKKKILDNREKLEAAKIDVDAMLRDFDLDKIEDRIIEELDPSLRLGAQSPAERQSEIDAFQSGRSLYCLFTFKSGGVGLSLHHSDEMIPEDLRDSAFKQLVKSEDPLVKQIIAEYNSKNVAEAKRLWNTQGGRLDEGLKLNLVLWLGCRRKESGYAFDEDIPFVPIRPRETIAAPTYSNIELAQGLGRAPRLTSLSATIQRLIFYRNSIEKDVFAVVAIKLRCLKAVVRQRESYMDIVEKYGNRDVIQKHIDSTPTSDQAAINSSVDEPEEVEV